MALRRLLRRRLQGSSIRRYSSAATAQSTKQGHECDAENSMYS